MRKQQGPDMSGKLFDVIMKKQKITKEKDLAEYLGEHQTAISQVRNGHREISAEMLMRILDKTGMTYKAAKAHIQERG